MQVWQASHRNAVCAFKQKKIAQQVKKKNIAGRKPSSFATSLMVVFSSATEQVLATSWCLPPSLPRTSIISPKSNRTPSNQNESCAKRRTRRLYLLQDREQQQQQKKHTPGVHAVKHTTTSVDVSPLPPALSLASTIFFSKKNSATNTTMARQKLWAGEGPLPSVDSQDLGSASRRCCRV